MISQVINNFRSKHGVGPALEVNKEEHEYCKLHCIHMSKSHLCHTPVELLHGKAEAVAICEFQGNIETTENVLIWQLLGMSSEHREILLNNRYLASYLLLHHYRAYLTVRGWN